MTITNFIVRGLYEVHARSFTVRENGTSVALYIGCGMFAGVSVEFGKTYIAIEYLAREHGGTNVPFDTVTPLRRIGSVPRRVPAPTAADPLANVDYTTLIELLESHHAA